MLTEKFIAEFKPVIKARGPKPAKIMLLGEAPGEQEEKLGIPFVGASGKELEKMLHEASINSGDVYMTNVFWTRPPNNILASFMFSSAQWKELEKNRLNGPTTGEPSSGGSPPSASLPMKIDNKTMYLHPAFHSEIARLHKEIEECQPNVIVALGNTALWSLTGRQNISSVRGTSMLSSTLSTQRKLLPTYHPAAVLRQWDLRPIVVADLMKAKAQSEFPEVRRPARQIIVNPTLADIEEFLTKLTSAELLSCDVETRNGQITEIGFAPSHDRALVVPFVRGHKDHYWPDAKSEAQALRLVRAILTSPIPKLFQNGLYDLQYIWKTWHIPVRNCLHDTMILHHAMYPEVQKGLGFLGSIYTDEPAWKLMRARKETQEKRDDE